MTTCDILVSPEISISLPLTEILPSPPVYPNSASVVDDVAAVSSVFLISAPVKYPAFKACVICDELYQTGFLIDEEFYCKECAKADFYNYLDKRKECE